MQNVTRGDTSNTPEARRSADRSPSARRRGAGLAAAGLLAAAIALLFGGASSSQQPSTGPTMMNANLAVRTVVSGLAMPTGMAFLGANDFLVLEKGSGRVQRVLNGAVQSTSALDLPVNAASERGLLGIALHPEFATNRFVYLFWTARSTTPLDADPFTPEEQTAIEAPAGTEDTEELLQVPLLANRVDRFLWNGSTLTFDRHLITLRAFQNDAAPTPPNQGDAQQRVLGNHDGGILTFGPDGKLYVFFGDVGRRGQLQNLPSGPTPTGLGDAVPDDQFGGPQPDNAHFSGVILRLNDDGTTPTDNPFFSHGATVGGEAGANIQRIFAYGFRNGFGMAFDPANGNLWLAENGEDAFDEINRVEAGMNGGWIQFMGPAAAVAEYKRIETTSMHHDEPMPNLQQFRWPPANIADTAEAAMSRLFMLPGARYRDPELSWKNVIAPAAIGFISSQALGTELQGSLIMGLSEPEPLDGPLLSIPLNADRMAIPSDKAGLADRIVDNAEPHQLGESESLAIGRGFGVVTDVETSPSGSLFVLSLSGGAVYEITRR